MKLEYRLKLPQAVYSFGMSPDGNHYAIGLVDGSLILRSKQLEEFEEEQDDEMKMIMNAFAPMNSFKSTAKNYKYFYRGQYGVTPDAADIIAGMQSKKQKLQAYEKLLKKFHYRQALSEAIRTNNPEVVVALIEELMQRGGLELALANRQPDELELLLSFIKWKLPDHRY